MTRPQKTQPPASARRPPAPRRPAPAKNPGITLLAAKMGRMRHRLPRA